MIDDVERNKEKTKFSTLFLAIKRWCSDECFRCCLLCSKRKKYNTRSFWNFQTPSCFSISRKRKCENWNIQYHIRANESSTSFDSTSLLIWELLKWNVKMPKIFQVKELFLSRKFIIVNGLPRWSSRRSFHNNVVTEVEKLEYFIWNFSHLYSANFTNFFTIICYSSETSERFCLISPNNFPTKNRKVLSNYQTEESWHLANPPPSEPWWRRLQTRMDCTWWDHRRLRLVCASFCYPDFAICEWMLAKFALSSKEPHQHRTLVQAFAMFSNVCLSVES